MLRTTGSRLRPHSGLFLAGMLYVAFFFLTIQPLVRIYSKDLRRCTCAMFIIHMLYPFSKDKLHKDLSLNSCRSVLKSSHHLPPMGNPKSYRLAENKSDWSALNMTDRRFAQSLPRLSEEWTAPNATFCALSKMDVQTEFIGSTFTVSTRRLRVERHDSNTNCFLEVTDSKFTSRHGCNNNK